MDPAFTPAVWIFLVVFLGVEELAHSHFERL